VLEYSGMGTASWQKYFPTLWKEIFTMQISETLYEVFKGIAEWFGGLGDVFGEFATGMFKKFFEIFFEISYGDTELDDASDL